METMEGPPEPTYDLFISYAEDDRAWVEGYLVDALAEAGVRTCSEAAFALGEPRALAFEHAVRASRRTLLVLSPAYVAESTARFADLLAQSYGIESATWPVIPLILRPVELPPRLAMLQALDATDEAAWEDIVARLCAEMARPVPGQASRPPCPYPGMVPFREQDSARFYGREDEVERLVKALRLHPFLAVIGPSGSGKSSLVYAGLVPALRQSGLFGAPGNASLLGAQRRSRGIPTTEGPRPISVGETGISTPGNVRLEPGDRRTGTGGTAWLVRAMRPGAAPHAALHEALQGDPSAPEAAVTALLTAHPDAGRLLLVVDQFEELFTHAQGEAAVFCGGLLGLAGVPQCYVVLTVRADFYPELMATPLWDEVQAHRAEVLPLGDEGLRQAIVRPAEAVGVHVEAALVERLVGDAAGEPGILPFVQETLVLLWERLERRYLPLRAYDALTVSGRTGLQVAMADRADAALSALPPDERDVARRTLLRLVQFGEGRADTRRQQRVSELRVAGEDAARFDRVLAHLAGHRLLTLAGEEGGTGRTVDIAHEALIGGWPTLQGWVRERRDAEQTRRLLESKAGEWVRLGRGQGGLLDEIELLEAERWLSSPGAEDLGTGEALDALVRRSREAIALAREEEETARQRELDRERALRQAEQARAQEAEARAQQEARSARNLSRLVAAMALLVLVALAAASVAFVQSRNAVARQLDAQAQTFLLQGYPHLATLLALEAYRVNDRVGAEVLSRVPYAIQAADAVALEGHSGWVPGVAWHPDGRVLASASGDGRVILWSPASGGTAGSTEDWEAAQTLEDPVLLPSSIAWHPGGELLAVGSAGGPVAIWSLAGHAAPRVSARLEGHSRYVTSVAWHPDGHTLASGASDQQVILWSVDAAGSGGERLATLETGAGDVWSMAWHPEGRLLAWGGGTGDTVLWDVEAGEVAARLEEHVHAVTGLAWHPQGRILASGSADGRVILWSLTRSADGAVERVEPVASFGEYRGTRLIDELAWHPLGQILAVSLGDGQIALWSIAEGADQPKEAATLEGLSAGALGLVWHPDGQMLATGTQDGHVVLWWPAFDAAGGVLPGERATTLRGHTGVVSQLAWRPDGALLASAGWDGDVLLWSPARGAALEAPVARLEGHTGIVWSTGWHPDGHLLASGSADGRVMLWRVTGGADGAVATERVAALEGHAADVTRVAWHPGGDILASGDNDGQTVLWALARGPGGEVEGAEPFAALEGQAGVITSLAWHRDGRVLATGDASGGVVLWSPPAGATVGDPGWEARTRLKAHSTATGDLVWHPEEPILATGGGDARIAFWSVDLDANGELQGARKQGGFQAHRNAINGLDWHPDGRTLAWSALDPSIALGRVAVDDKGRVVGEDATWALMGHADNVTGLAWRPDGGALATASADSTILVLPEALTGEPCEWLVANLSVSQWRTYRGLGIYRPTCANLPSPEMPRLIDALREGDLDLLLVTVRGRLLLFGVPLGLLALLGLCAWGVVVVVRRLVRRGKTKRGEQLEREA